MHVPPQNMFTRDHLKAILEGQKRLMKLKDVKFVSVPMYDELSVKQHYDKMLAKKEL